MVEITTRPIHDRPRLPYKQRMDMNSFQTYVIIF